MSLIRYEANPISALLNELDNLWVDDFSRTGRDLAHLTYPNVDIVESDTGYGISADLPGISKEDVKVNIDNGVLQVNIKKTAEAKPKTIEVKVQ